MSVRDRVSSATINKWGDYDIMVKVIESPTINQPANITSTYQIFKFGQVLAFGSVPATYDTVEEAAQSALRIAKLDIRESLDGPFPSY